MLAAGVELTPIRPLYRRHIEQVLAGGRLAFALACQGIGARPSECTRRRRGSSTRRRCSGQDPNDRFVEIAAAVVVLLGLFAFLRFTRYGLIIRAGVENRAMVTALGIDVRRAFTLVFAIGVLAALAGVLSGVYFGSIDPGARRC